MTSKTAPSYTAEEQDQVLSYLLRLRKERISPFLEEHELATGGTKEELRERIQDAIASRTITYADIVNHLDMTAPWGKQHVFLYDGPRERITDWKNPAWVANLLKRHRLRKYLNASLPLILPERLRLSAISHNTSRLRITAVERRDRAERNPEYDEERSRRDGATIELRAYIHFVDRGLISFDWDLIANTAFLQISQLAGGRNYDEAVDRFRRLVNPWLDLTRFEKVDISKAISHLHELEQAGTPEARSHEINYRTLAGRRLAAYSASARDSVLGEITIDEAMEGVRKSGQGHLGNFYWLPPTTGTAPTVPLTEEVHVTLVGSDNRINLMTAQPEKIARYVLGRVRTLSN